MIDAPGPRAGAGRGPRDARAVLALVGFVAAVAVAASLGSLAAADSASTYTALDLPPFAPPAWLFGPAWTALYAMIAAAAWLVLLRCGWDRSLTVWAIQLVLNAAWTPLFFAAGQYTLAFAEIVVLWCTVLLCTAMFLRRRLIAGLLLVSYVLWVAYAGALNLAIAIAIAN